MSEYTTGELARLCSVSVRTVQFYDQRDLLKPSALSEGGRRLYSDADLNRMRLICLLRALGLSLDAIHGVLGSDNARQILLLLLDEQQRQLRRDIGDKKAQVKEIEAVRTAIKANASLTAESIADIEHIMENNRKLRSLHVKMLVIGSCASALAWGTAIVWICTGVWWPFIIGMTACVVLCCLLSVMYYRSTEYICPNCGKQFRPSFKAAFFASHTPKTRRLVCPECGVKDWCVEVAAE